MKGKLISIFLLFILNVVFCSAQTLDEARELYKLGEYERALPVFEKEYKEKPTDASLNQWYGVCLFETGGNLVQAEECISFAAKKNIPDAFLYLAKIYAKTYRFGPAEKELDRYARLKRRDKEAMVKVENERKHLSSLKRAASHVENIQVVDSVIIDKDRFLSAYRLSPSSGSVDYYGNFFKSAGKIFSTTYLNEKKDKIFYAKPDETKKYSLFSMEKLLEDFGNEKKVSKDNFDFTGDLNYPYIMADGVTIYFAAQDDNGFGGYDIYVTRYNLNNDTYLTPERLNMPFNSSFNDYLYAVDEEKGVGWFATDRFQPDGKVCVYTFIPNERVDIIESDEDEYLIERARIKSIRETWRSGVNYNAIVSLARKEIEEKEEIKKDFELVINDKYTYYLYSDFKNPTARDIFRQAMEKKNSIHEVQSKLNALRDNYSKSSSNNTKKEILDLENRQGQLYNEFRDLEKKARNQEIGTLNR